MLVNVSNYRRSGVGGKAFLEAPLIAGRTERNPGLAAHPGKPRGPVSLATASELDQTLFNVPAE
jgi:hypothetical protein